MCILLAMKTKPKRDTFSPAKAACVHVTIEAVFDLDNCRDMQDTLDQLAQYGCAVIVKKQTIGEDFDEACAILARRKLKEAP